jgi:hypothetical protein
MLSSLPILRAGLAALPLEGEASDSAVHMTPIGRAH